MQHLIHGNNMKVGDKVIVNPFITTDPANQKGKEGVVVEIINNEGLNIVKVRFNKGCYGLYDGDTLKVTTKSKEQ
nr:MAG TPA: ferredoxin-thioredoxin reductase [Caudoviricetes sp.]